MEHNEIAAWAGSVDRMPEAEVSLRLAEYLTTLEGFDGHIDVAIDGASVRVHGAEVFNIVGYLATSGWKRCEAARSSKNEWATTYERTGATMRVHSQSGVGDVVALISGRRVVAECKKGPLVKKPGSQEYALLTTALGQALLFPAKKNDIVLAAVPDTAIFRRLAVEWRNRPLVTACGLQIALVNRNGTVDGLSFT